MQTLQYLRQAAINGIRYHLDNPTVLSSDILPRCRQYMISEEGRYLVDVMLFECGGPNPLPMLKGLFADLEIAEGLTARTQR